MRASRHLIEIEVGLLIAHLAVREIRDFDARLRRKRVKFRNQFEVGIHSPLDRRDHILDSNIALRVFRREAIGDENLVTQAKWRARTAVA